MADETPIEKPEKPKKAKKPALTVIEKSSLEALMEKMNDEYAVILRGSQVFIMRHWLGEDKKAKISFLSKRDFLIFQENNKLCTVDAQDNKEAIKIAPAWIQWHKRKTYEEVYFEPNGIISKKRYNLWQGFAVKPQETEVTEGFDLFIDHIFSNICQGNQEIFDWVMAWLADMFQNPAHKPGTALILRGGKGVGKGFFAHTIGKLLGIHYMSITQSSQLTGKFNGHMMDKILLFVDEGWWSDERKDAGVLNGLITEPSVAIEMKGKDAIYIDNYTRFIIAANSSRIVEASLDERRMAILDVGETAQQNKEYFSAIDQQMKSGGYAKLLHYLLHYKYDAALPKIIPQTAALAEHRLYSMPHEMQWWQQCLFQEKVGAYNLTNVYPPNNDIECEKFYEAYINYCRTMQIRPFALNILPKRLKAFLELNKARNVNYIYQLQALDDLRAKFEFALGDKVDWEEA